MPPNPTSPDPPRPVVMVAYPDAQILDVTGPLEVFSRTARWLQDEGYRREPAYTVEIVGRKRGPLRTSSGIELVAGRAYHELTEPPHTLLITGGVGYRQAMEDERLLAWIRDMSTRVRRLGSVCTGAMVLAKAGLLDGLKVTTHWAYCRELEAASAAARVDPDAIYVRNDRLYTSAGVTAGMDMALGMVEEDWGQPVALAVARELVLFLKRPGGQSQFSRQLQGQQSASDRFQKLTLWMLDNLEQDLTVETLADRANMSPRNFARRFAAEIGVGPGRYAMQLRLEGARRMLEETDLNVKDIARGSGFPSYESMRRTFARELRVCPGDYRTRFRGTGEAAP